MTSEISVLLPDPLEPTSAVVWPAGDVAILGLLAAYAVTAAMYISIERRHTFGFAARRLA